MKQEAVDHTVWRTRFGGFHRRAVKTDYRENIKYNHCILLNKVIYSGADKSLARPGRKKPTATEDFEFHISYLLI